MNEGKPYSWFWRKIIQFVSVIVVTDCMFPISVSTLVCPVGLNNQFFTSVVCDLIFIYLVLHIFQYMFLH